MVDNKTIGNMKLEHKINEGIFITGKTYCFKDVENNYINKAKGITNRIRIYTFSHNYLKYNREI